MTTCPPADMQSELEILSAAGFQQETYDPLLQVVQVTQHFPSLSFSFSKCMLIN